VFIFALEKPLERMNSLRLSICLLALTMTIIGCVPARKYQDEQARKNEALTKADQSAKRAQQAEAKNAELEEELKQLKKSNEALVQDTTIMGKSLALLKGKYDKINELNEILSLKSEALLKDASKENQKLLKELDEARLDLQKREDALRKLEGDIDAKQNALTGLTTELEQREKRLKELEDLLAKQSENAEKLRQKVSNALLGFRDKGLNVVEKNGKVYVSMEAKLLFPSGSTKIEPEGRKALIDLAKAIENESELEIVVEGHTDTDKLNSSTSPRNNWELSVLRATAVVEIMMANSSVKPTILSAAGRSEYHPVDPNDKSKNRRIEIILSPRLDELFEIIEKN
jgi:chemotaxis protein MotB